MDKRDFDDLPGSARANGPHMRGQRIVGIRETVMRAHLRALQVVDRLDRLVAMWKTPGP